MPNSRGAVAKTRGQKEHGDLGVEDGPPKQEGHDQNDTGSDEEEDFSLKFPKEYHNKTLPN